MKLVPIVTIFLALGTWAGGLQPASANPKEEPKRSAKMNDPQKNLPVATLAGGCFWCVESDFKKLPGVVQVISGYAGGRGANPTYEDYARKGYVEAVQVFYDPQKLTYQGLIDYFWRHMDPTDSGGQFVDRGPQYRGVIYYHDEEQRRLAEESKTALGRSGHFPKPIVTEISKFTNFYPAEDYHQDYAHKNPVRYKYYRWNSGRDQFLKKTWGGEAEAATVASGAEPKAAADLPGNQKYTKPSDEVLRKKLTPMQYKVTQEEGTEPAFKNEYADNHREGIYVDIVSGEPL